MRTSKLCADTTEEETFKVFVRIRPLIASERLLGDSKTNGKIINVVEEDKENTKIYITNPDMIYDYVGRQERGFEFDNVVTPDEDLKLIGRKGQQNNSHSLWKWSEDGKGSFPDKESFPINKEDSFSLPGQKTKRNQCIFQEHDSNENVFTKTIEPLLPSILEGYNATWFVYGMTGSGKTHTMLGDIYGWSTGEKGLCLMTVEKLFMLMDEQLTRKFRIKISYLEIYNEHVIDLLNDSQTQLMIVEDPVRGVLVPDLREIEVEHPNELVEVIVNGNNRRTMASTSANQFSSRSHAILQISIQTSGNSLDMAGQIYYSKLSLIDLAGSERASTTSNRGQRMVEGANINKSLLALCNCINILSDKNKQGSFVPYRDSKLTRLLKDSLGGNTKTWMIACVSPSYSCYQETINTLRYAERAKNIKKKTRKNIKDVEIHMSKYKKIIDGLKGEIDSLKIQLKLEQDKKDEKERKHHKKVFNAHLLESKTERDEALDMLQGYGAVKTNLHVSQIIDQINWISDLSILNGDDIWELDGKNDFNDDLEAIKKERENLENKLNNNDISIWHAESSYFDKIRNQLYSNFEEEWDIAHSIAEINDLQKENNERILFLANQMEELIELKEHSDDEQQKMRIGEQLNIKLNEIENLERAMQDNANVLKEWIDAKKINEENRARIQNMFTNMQSSKKKDIIELQIAMRRLKLEKADLHLQNLEIKKEIMTSKRQNESKDKKLKILQSEIEKMKRDLAIKDRELERSKQILLQKDDELNRIKKIAWLSPNDVNRLANDKSNIEVLQQIALNNQLSPGIYSSLSMHSKENKSALNHPIYQSLKIRQQENIPSVCSKDSSNTTYQKHSAQLISKENGVFQPTAKLLEERNISRGNWRGASNRYRNEMRLNREQESFQTISSVSATNEMSAATDVRLEDFFDPNHAQNKGCYN
jgi:hypothetical protein